MGEFKMKLVMKIRRENSRLVSFLENRPRGLVVRRTINSDLIVTLPVDENGRCDILPIFSSEKAQMNINEVRMGDGFVTVVADSRGNPLWPYWIRNRKSQCQQDGIDVRFSVTGGACVATLNRRGLLILSSVFLKKGFDPDEKTDYIQIKEEEMMSVVLKRNGGKFLFPSREFSRRPSLKGYASVVEAAITKANKPNSGPVYFLEKEASVIFHEADGNTVVMTARKRSQVFSGGLVIPNRNSSPGMTVRSAG